MTDARYPERWLNDRRVLRLSDQEHRMFVVSLAWSVSNREDGWLDPDDLRLIPGWSADVLPGLERSGLWEMRDKRWFITVFADTQSTKTQLEGLDLKRRQDRDRQAKKRARDRGEADSQSRDNPRDGRVTSHVTTKARQGQARLGPGDNTSPEDKADDAWVRKGTG